MRTLILTVWIVVVATMGAWKLAAAVDTVHARLAAVSGRLAPPAR